MKIWKEVMIRENGDSLELQRKFEIFEREAFEFDTYNDVRWMYDNIVIFDDVNEVYDDITHSGATEGELVEQLWNFLSYKQKCEFVRLELAYNTFNNGEYFYDFIFKI